MAQGAVVITAQVKDTQQARRELENLGRASSQAGELTSRANSEIAVSAKAAALETQRLQQQQAEFAAELVKTTGQIAMATGQISMLAIAILEAREHTGTITAALGLLTGRLIPIGAIAFAAAAGIKALAESNEYLSQTAIPAAAAAESAMTSLRVVTERTGNSFAEAQQTLNAFDDALTTRTAVAQAVRTFNSMNISMERQQELISAIRDGIVAMGGDVNTQLPIMALAIKRQESELLDNMGVVSTVEQMYKRYAASIGTTADKLTQAQREEAVMKGVLEETSRYTGSAAAAMDTYQGKVNALANEQRKLAEEIGATFAPLAALVVEIERGVVALQRWTWKNVIARPVTDELTRLPFGIPNPMQPWIDARAAREAATDAERRLGMKHAERAYSIWAAREGGYGPALPDRMSEDERKFYENRAREIARAEEEAKREAERIVNNQKRLREQLNRDLALVDKRGYDRERELAMQAHQERLKLAHGDAELMRQSRTIYYKQIADIDKREQAEDLKRLEDWQRERRALRADSMAEGFESTLREIQGQRESRATSFTAQLEPLGDLDTRQQIEAEIQRINDLLYERNEATGELKLSINEQVAAMQRIADLNGRLVRMDQERADSWAQIALDVASVAGRLGSQAIRDGGVSAGDATRGLAGTIGGIIGTAIAPGIGTAIGTTAGDIIGDIVGAAFDRHDEAARLQEKAAEEQRRAAEEQLKAARERQQNTYDAGSFIVQQARELNWERMLAEARGTDRFEEVQTQVEMMRAIEGRVNDFRRALGLISQASGGHESWMLDEFTEQVKAAVYDGSLSAEDRQFLESSRYGDIFRDAMSSGHGGLLLDAIQNLADAIALETSNAQNRVLPGSSPQNPSYNVIVNFKDMWAFAPKDALYRASSPGTRRDDSGSERGINVGGRR